MTEAWAARGFGPGLPAEGAAVALRIRGERLAIDGWPGVGEVRRTQVQTRRQGSGLLLEWPSADGACALLIEEKIGAGDTALAAWLKAVTPSVSQRGHDAATRNWLRAALFLLIGLPVLLLAGFFGFRGQIIDAAVAHIPVEQEKVLADALWKLQRAQLKLIEGTAANRFVEQTGARLVAAQPSPYTYRFHIADDNSINAFAIPAGYIVVHRGLIEKAQSAEEVAGVLAHEIEHVEQRHSLRGMAQAVGLAALWTVVTGDVGGGIAGSWIKELAGLNFSREQENLADAGGYHRLVAAGIAARGMASFFDALAVEQAKLPGMADMLATHPASAERADRLKALLKDAPLLPPLLPVTEWHAVKADFQARSGPIQ